jgi:hypothetical protein
VVIAIASSESEFNVSSPMTFVDQRTKQVRKSWVKYACSSASNRKIRARVFLRGRLGREPTQAEVTEHERDKSLAGNVTDCQIMDAFDSGKEVYSLLFCCREC